MLYATTRGKHDVVTAYKTIHTDCYSDGGLFVPFRMPKLNTEQLAALVEASASQIVANILNQFFSGGLISWDVEFAVGRRPVKTAAIGRRLLSAELWHNAGCDADHAAQRLSDRIRGCGGEVPSNWVRIAVRIALLFASYGALVASGSIRPQRMLDVAVTTGDFTMPMAAWYARQMGLPIGNIICGCNDNGSVWDLLNRGEFFTGDILTRTSTPEADLVVPRNLERLIHAVFGPEETKRYLLCCSKGRTYTLSEENLQKIRQGFFAAVISDCRVANIIPGVYRTHGYVLGPYGALAYGSLQDYRATTGQTRQVLLVSERSPLRDARQICDLLRIKENDLQRLIGR